MGLCEAGRDLWERLVGTYEFDARELLVVAAAARQADDLARLEAVIASDGVVTVGSAGQPRMAQVVAEARLARLALAKLLGDLVLPVEESDEPTESAASRRARKAADARWMRERQREERRRGSSPA